MADSYVCSGAMMKCTMGTAPAKLTVLPIRTVNLCGQPQANISDHKTMVNLAPFGLCRSLAFPQTAAATAAAMGTLTPTPCMHNTPMPWMGGKMDYLIKGQPALLKSCKCQCMWGGTISLINDGQVGVGTQFVQKRPKGSFGMIEGEMENPESDSLSETPATSEMGDANTEDEAQNRLTVNSDAVDNNSHNNTSENPEDLESGSETPANLGSEDAAPTNLEPEDAGPIKTVSNVGVELIKEFEGCRLKAYKDPVGVWTIGYGTTNADMSITSTEIKQGVTISQQQADAWLMTSLNNKYAPKVSKYDSIYHWTQNEFDALVSFAYNIGNIDELVNYGKRSKQEIANQMLKYVYAKKVVLPGLVRRRRAEHDLFLS